MSFSFLANPSSYIDDFNVYGREMSTQSINEKQDNGNLIKIYPNPANTNISVEVSQTDKNSILSIYNMIGIELIKQPIKENKTQIDISQLKSGIYFIKVTRGDIITTKKIVKL